MPKLVSCLGALSLMCLAMVAGGWSAPANADTAPALTQAAPPRPTIQPLNAPLSASSPYGAHIELILQSTWPAGAIAVVQWGDTRGNWFNVEGWRGSLGSSIRSIRWWVARKDYGTGPFRWIVRDLSREQTLAISATFNLPRADGQLITIATLNAP